MVTIIVADRFTRRCRPLMIAGVLVLPVYLISWVSLIIFAPGIGKLFDPFFPGEPGDVNVLVAFLYGSAMIASITSFGRLMNPRQSTGERP